MAVVSSPGIEPHVNPQRTSANGEFRWDVVSDYYKVAAPAHGCHAPGDPAQTTVSTPGLTRPAARASAWTWSSSAATSLRRPARQ